ncbi:MAG: hypothetical protein A2X25_04635 [Chloroflexi bacterium GWB2_49_20]|nr:MAG: hypothetical protein A2X25_04635 [Chloroflexi bacterium GWB2_49_20]OGN80474.1 MAG: hypothetical protein A2X26_11745 [Chloroflexi bacterium GWC2_49_37]OGN83309.1 MAG: hypothetical protein A2X27_11920 [Chloroflexi bacterium GWD2_49_16]HCC78202.1 hypothetical protein [Anaerolineae bacterium]
MSNNSQNKNMVPSQNGGLIKDFIRHIKLIWLLMTDKRVNIFLKLLPITSLVYLVSPIDLVSGLALPVIGALDDAAIVWIGTSLFISLCPEYVVEEHVLSLEKVITTTWKDVPGEDEVVDAEARDITGDQPK